MNGAEPQTAVLARPVDPEPAFGTDLSAKPGYLATCELEVVFGQFGPQFRGGLAPPRNGNPAFATALGAVALDGP